jgi:hypothetical protein
MGFGLENSPGVCGQAVGGVTAAVGLFFEP